MLEPSFLALTSTPSMAPSSAEDTCPLSAMSAGDATPKLVIASATAGVRTAVVANGTPFICSSLGFGGGRRLLDICRCGHGSAAGREHGPGKWGEARPHMHR